MLYCSTRGGGGLKSFDDVVLASYASDGGLYVPECLPHVTMCDLEGLRSSSFPQVCAFVLSLFCDIPITDLNEMATVAFSSFNDGVNVLPLQKIEELTLLDTSLGPTFAFKDIGQQMMAQILNYVLGKRGMKAKVAIDTSGDTGPAAIAGVKGCAHVDIFCLYPEGRVSNVQELQMITVTDSNVHVYRTEGNTDDQASVLKELFLDEEFSRENNLCSVNSINWVRIAAQASYFVWSYLAVCNREKKALGDPVNYFIPTGAFGNAMGGYLAKRMGLPIGKFVCATNANDIVHRTLSTGDMSMGKNVATESPAMDIQFAYNLERMLYYVTNEDAQAVKPIMVAAEQQFDSGEASKGVQLEQSLLSQIQETFLSCTVSDEQTLSTIRDVYEKYNVMLCPHSAIAVYAARTVYPNLVPSAATPKGTISTPVTSAPAICVLTAHPAKFQACMQRAIGRDPIFPQLIQELNTKPHRYEELRKTSDDPKVWRAEWIKRLKADISAV